MKNNLLLLLILISLKTFSQGTVSELSFKNCTLLSGVAGADSARYLFPNVTTGYNAVDAIVKIMGRSNLSVVDSIDATTIGYANAFQPIVGRKGNIPANTSWWMDFQIEFVATGSGSPAFCSFNALGIDIDGDDNKLHEWIKMYKVDQVVSSGSQLTVASSNCVSSVCDYQIDGPITNFLGIDSTNETVIAAYRYVNKNKITIRLGATNGTGTTPAGMRINAIIFRQFNVVSILPVKFIKVQVTLSKN